MMKLTLDDYKLVLNVPGNIIGYSGTSNIKALNNNIISKFKEEIQVSKGILITYNINANKNTNIKDIDKVMETLNIISSTNSLVLYGITIDDSLKDDEIKYTVLICGLRSK